MVGVCACVIEGETDRGITLVSSDEGCILPGYTKRAIMARRVLEREGWREGRERERRSCLGLVGCESPSSRLTSAL